MSQSHRLLLLNATDRGGGTEIVAANFLNGMRRRGHQAHLVVGQRFTDDPYTIAMPASPWQRMGNAWAQQLVGKPGSSRMRRKLAVVVKAIAQPRRAVNYLAGRENFDYPATKQLLLLTDSRPTLVHAHNLHSDYFDLRHLPTISQQLPTLITLHDAWMLAGHCAHSFDCSRWQTGCGQCPYLHVPMPVWRDRTSQNWQLKKEIYKQCRLYIATPSHWLMQRVEKSMLAPAIIEKRVIPNGIDLNLFQPGSMEEARSQLNLPVNGHLILCSGAALRENPWKDYPTLQSAIKLIAAQQPIDQPVQIIILGQRGSTQTLGSVSVRFVAFTTDLARVARYYQATDIYLHAAKVDTFPTTVLEAMACQAAVVATDVGGIGEQIQHYQTGILTKPGDPHNMAKEVSRLLRDQTLRQNIAQAAADAARERFGLERQIDSYVQWYDQIAATCDSTA
jgi:glycosyltransferase involved in cell wall biosynthesis